MADPSPATSVVISTYNDDRWDDLAACVESLGRQSEPPGELILVVDHNEPLLERARAAFPQAEVIANRRSRGLAGARNSGIDCSRGEVVAFIDDDARAEPNWLGELARCFERDEVVGAGGELLPRWVDGVASWIPREFYWVFGCTYAGLPETAAPVRNPIGANMAVRRSVLEGVGGFREGESGEGPRDIPSRGVVRAGGNIPDDTDLAIRVKQLIPTAVWLYQPAARVLHTVTPERATLAYFLRRCYEEGVGKANLARYVGSAEGLSSERRHLLVALPRGVGLGMIEALRGDLTGLSRAAAIVVGVLSSAAGFAVATAKNRVSGQSGS